MTIKAILHLALLAQAAPQAYRCHVDEAKPAALTVKDFDQDMKGGSRELEAKGCQSVAADMIKAFRARNTEMPDSERTKLKWHEGQLRAIIDEYRSAIPLLMAGVPENDTIDFADYAFGTVSFLLRDRSGLLAARARLAGAKKPDSFPTSYTVRSGTVTETIPIAWPVNIEILDGLIKCFDQPYRQAYNCRP